VRELPEFEDSVCVDRLLNWEYLQKLLRDRPDKFNLVEEVVFAAGGKLMEVAEERSFKLPWRMEATKTTDEPIYSLELTGSLAQLRPCVLLEVERHFTLPLSVILTDSEGRKARLNVKPSRGN